MPASEVHQLFGAVVRFGETLLLRFCCWHLTTHFTVLDMEREMRFSGHATAASTGVLKIFVLPFGSLFSSGLGPFPV